MSPSIRRVIAIIILIFATLTVASVFSNNDLLWGLDSFPHTDPPAGMNIVVSIAYMSMLGSVGLLWFRAFLVRDVDVASKKLALGFSLISIVAHILLVGFIRIWELNLPTSELFSSQAWDVEPQASSIRAVTCLVIGFPIQHFFANKDVKVERNRWMVILGGLIALGSLTVVGHTAYQPPTWISHGVDFVHGVGASLWFGGLIGFVLYLQRAFRTRDNALETGRVLTEFSTWALYSVIALAFSGVVIASMVKDDVTDLTGSPFAKALSLKLLIAIIPIAIAAYNRFKLMPMLKADPDSPQAWSLLRKTTLAEVVVLVAILFVTGVLVLASPV